MGRCTSTSVGIVEGHRMRFEGIELRSSSFVAAWIPYVFALRRAVYFPVGGIRGDCGSAGSSEGNVAMPRANVLDRRALFSHRLR